jgi:hypothetical protein
MLLRKEIIPEGIYLVNSDTGRIKKEFSKEYLQQISDTGNAMIEAGLKIPAPFGHSKKAIPELEIELNQKTTPSPYNNAGYWSFFDIVTNPLSGKPTLVGYSDLPGSKEDKESSYYKALNSAKEVSISIKDEFTDGLSRTWKNVPMHVALVNHAVVPGQKDFEEVPDGSSILNLSMVDNEDTVDISMLASIKQVMQEAFGVILPGSSDVNTFLRDLYVAASQCKASRPDGQDLEITPIYMSIGEHDMALTLEQAKTLVAANTTNPGTGKPFTLEDFGFQQKPQLDLSTLQAEITKKDAMLTKATGIVAALVNHIKQNTKSAITSRINALISKGTITKEFADSTFAPALDFEMATTSTGEFAQHPLEVTLSTLEQVALATAKPATSPFQGFGDVQPLPHQSTELSAVDIKDNITDFLNFLP